MTKPRSFEEVQTMLTQLDTRLAKFETQDIDLHQRKIINASGASIDTDYATLADVKSATSANSNSDQTGGIFKQIIQAIVGLVTKIIAPPADSTTALKITKADKTTALMTFDTTTPEIDTAANIHIYNGAATNAKIFIGQNSTVKRIHILYNPTTNAGFINSFDTPNYRPLSLEGNPINLGLTSGGSIVIGATAASIGFFNASPATFQVLNSYIPLNLSFLFTTTPAALAQAATIADLNTLRNAYENLRISYEDLRSKLQTTTLVG